MKINVKHYTRSVRSKLAHLWSRTAVAALVAGSFANQAFAVLPTSEAPTKGEGNSLMDTLKNYGLDGAVLLGLAVAVCAFTGVAYHALSTFSAIHTGKKTWADFGLTVTVGALLLVIIIWLLTKAATIMT